MKNSSQDQFQYHTTHFIGYSSLEEWAKSTDKTQPVYAMPIETSTSGSNGFSYHALTIMVGQPDGALVHCVSLEAAKLTYLHGSYFGDKADEQSTRARMDQVWDIVRDWLIEQGFAIRQAAVAMPEGFRLVDGWADFLAYDRENKRYFDKIKQKETIP